MASLCPSVPALGFQVHWFQRNFFHIREQIGPQNRKKSKMFLILPIFLKEIYTSNVFFYCICLIICAKSMGSRNPSLNFHGFHGTHANAATAHWKVKPWGVLTWSWNDDWLTINILFISSCYGKWSTVVWWQGDLTPTQQFRVRILH